MALQMTPLYDTKPSNPRSLGRQQKPAPEGQADISRGQARSAPPPV